MVLTPASNFPLHNKLTGHVRPGPVVNPYFTGRLYDYRESVFKNVQRELPDYVRFRTVMPAWDNTARRQNNPDIFVHSSPGAYQAWLENALETTRELYFGDERIVFINAWNE